MTDRSNIVPLHPEDRGMIEGPVGFVPLHRAMPDGPRLAVLRDRQISVCRRSRGAIAIAVISSDRFLFGFACFSFGCLFTVSAAYVWSFFL